MPLPGSASEVLLQNPGSCVSFFLNFFGSRILIERGEEGSG
jgi:hypothetical protein